VTSTISAALAQRIKLVVLDVDGVLTDGGIVLGDVGGERLELKRYDIQDGIGIKMLQRAGIRVAVVTGRVSKSVELRALELGIDDVIQDEHARKVTAVRRLAQQAGIAIADIACVADDLPDLGIMREVGLAAAVSNARSGLGRALIKLGRYADALSELNDAYADAVECGDDTRQVFVLHSLSELHGHQGQYKEAIVTLARALEIRAAKHPPRRASILNSMGWQYGFLGEFSQTLALGQEARAIYETSGDLNGMAAALDTLGFGWHGSGDLVLAIEHYQRAIDIRLEVGESYEAASSLRRLGEVHLDQGDQQAAAKAWQRAAEILEPICHPDLYVVRAKLAAIG